MFTAARSDLGMYIVTCVQLIKGGGNAVFFCDPCAGVKSRTVLLKIFCDFAKSGSISVKNNADLLVRRSGVRDCRRNLIECIIYMNGADFLMFQCELRVFGQCVQDVGDPNAGIIFAALVARRVRD